MDNDTTSESSATDWYAPLADLQSLGSAADRPGSLAGLHAARQMHLGQFFTPPALVNFIWALIAAPMSAATANGRRASLLDTSIGTGRMFMPADPERHALFGCDVHAPSIDSLAAAAQTAGFVHQFEAGGMQSVRVANFDFALINPPFSVHLESPTLEPFSSTCFGKYGPNTSAISHSYAVDQALDAAQIVVAVLPRGFALERAAQGEARLVAHLRLPSALFADEGTAVDVDLLVYGNPVTAHGQPLSLAVSSLREVPALDLVWVPQRLGMERLRSIYVSDDGPVITRLITGNAAVRVAHDGRRIRLGFQCGFVEAKVLNAVYRNRIEAVAIEEWRYPRGLRYDGQYALDLEAHLAQPDPLASVHTLLNTIRQAGGQVHVAPGFFEHIVRRARRSRRQSMPLRHTVFCPDGVDGDVDTIVGTARFDQTADPSKWISPLIHRDEVVAMRSAGAQLTFDYAGQSYSVSVDEARKRFSLDVPDREPGWRTVHPGLVETFPEVAKSVAAQVEQSGVKRWLTWGFQSMDLTEVLMKPNGCVLAWHMALGKGRMAAALILASGVRHGLIVTEAYLVYELMREFAKIGLPADQWQVIDSPKQLTALRRINLISYTRLPMPVPRLDGSGLPSSHMTYAKRLRRRIGMAVVDEGEAMANMTSERTRAVWALSARHRVLMSGTPAGNYPRQIQPLLVLSAGDGTAAQPYGHFGPKMERYLAQSAQYAQRGIDAMREFSTFEWVTNLFTESMQTGAKREIPRLQKLNEYRAALAPHVKRRVKSEPDVARYVSIPSATPRIHTVDFDERHLLHYLTVAEDFVSWYRKAREDGRTNNLIALLARIGAVELALNAPQRPSKFKSYCALTSKDRFALDHVEALTLAGDRTLLFAHHPQTVIRLSDHLLRRGIQSVLVHGGLPVRERDELIATQFCTGARSVLLATHGVLKRGSNLPQANRVVLYDRDWKSSVEDQAIARALRGDQTSEVTADYIHIRGSLDEYMAQVVAFKTDCAASGLDWAAPGTTDTEFVHMDTIFGSFCESVAALRGVKRHDLRRLLAAA